MHGRGRSARNTTGPAPSRAPAGATLCMNCAVCDWTPSTATDHTVGTSCPEVNSVVRQQDPVLLDNVLDGAREEYAAANPSSRARHEAALASMPGGEHPHGSSPRTV